MKVFCFLFILLFGGCKFFNTGLKERGKRTTTLDDLGGDKRGGEVVGYDPGADYSQQTQPLQFYFNGGSLSGNSFSLSITDTPEGRPVNLKAITLVDQSGATTTHSVLTPSPSKISPSSPYNISIDLPHVKTLSHIAMTIDYSEDFQQQPKEFVFKGNQGGEYGMKNHSPSRYNFFENNRPTVFVPYIENVVCDKDSLVIGPQGECVPYGKWCSDISQTLKESKEEKMPCTVKMDGETIYCVAASSYKGCLYELFGSTQVDLCTRFKEFFQKGFSHFLFINFEKQSYAPTNCGGSNAIDAEESAATPKSAY